MLNYLPFYLLFISQIVVISYYYPRLFINKMDTVLIKFPPEQYPKLYTKSVENLQKDKNVFALINKVILFAGFILVIWLFMRNAVNQTGHFNVDFLFAEDFVHAPISNKIPLLFGLVQFIPFALIEIASCNQLKLMRENNKTTLRSASLKPRHITDFVSLTLLITAAITTIIYFAFDLVIHQFTLDSDIAIRFATIGGVNLLFIAMTLIRIYGKKRNPYQSEDDRNREIGTSVKSMAYISIIANIYFIIHTASNSFDLPFLELIVNSSYFLFIAFFGFGLWMNSIKLDEMNFDVYKVDTTT